MAPAIVKLNMFRTEVSFWMQGIHEVGFKLRLRIEFRFVFMLRAASEDKGGSWHS